MSKPVKASREMCIRCYYFRQPAGSLDGHTGNCDYIGIEGHSRLIENGKRKDIPKGYCDCFKSCENTEKSKSAWKREGESKWKRRQENILIASDVDED